MTSICLKRIFRRRVTWGQLITLFKPVKILFLYICARGWVILEQGTNFKCLLFWEVDIGQCYILETRIKVLIELKVR